MKRYFILALCAMLSVGLITGCGSKKEEKKEEVVEEPFEEIETCPGCVYSFYKGEKQYKMGEKLTDYTDNYKTLKDDNGQQRTVFLGHVLNENGEIERGYACGIKDGKAFCIEGSRGAYYDQNKEILENIYGNNCTRLDNWLYCMEGAKGLSARNDDSGTVYVKDSYYCIVQNDRKMYCSY